MHDSISLHNNDIKKRNLTFKFCLAAMLVTSLVVVVVTSISYFQISSKGLDASLYSLAKIINIEASRKDGKSVKNRNIGNLAEYWQTLSMLQGAQTGAFFDSNLDLVWSSNPVHSISNTERSIVSVMLKKQVLSQIVDSHKLGWTSLNDLFGDPSRLITGYIVLKDRSGGVFGILKIVRSYEHVFYFSAIAAKSIFWIVLVGNLFLFLVLLHHFLRRLRTIDDQEERHNQQISNLSKLLTLNKDMRKNMKSASSRAVELNEQFLRRVGSDLHDGPAQSIGYAVMRLDKVAKDEAAKKFNQDFHVVKEALDSSLDEIRGISSGLVLPELEVMTLTEALNKVVVRHTDTFSTVVTPFLTDLPDQVPLPIKICAYRFVQEGLNNAHRHGQAEKCRLTAYIKGHDLHLSLKDNGMGFRKSQLAKDGGHLGLMGLKDRIESLGGKFSINSELGVGTAIKMSISLDDEV